MKRLSAFLLTAALAAFSQLAAAQAAALRGRFGIVEPKVSN